VQVNIGSLITKQGVNLLQRDTLGLGEVEESWNNEESSADKEDEIEPGWAVSECRMSQKIDRFTYFHWILAKAVGPASR
jgi:hypothetical protein